MPLYALKCQSCAHAFEHACTMRDRDNAACPKCGGPVETDWEHVGSDRSVKFNGNRQFHGSEGLSFTEGFRPWEVPLARRHITAGTIRDDGRVEFKDRKDQQEFMRQQDRLRSGLVQTLGEAG